MPDRKLTDLNALAAIVPANLLLYVVDTSEVVLADKSKKLTYTLFEAYTDARYLQDAPSNGSQYARQNGAWAVVTGGVASVFGRTGAVVAASGDYNAGQITNTPAGGIAAVTVQAALDELDTEKAAIASLAAVATTGAYADLSGTPTLGTLAALNSPLPILNGGTGATTDSGARTNLGLAIGSNVQAWDADLDTLAGLAKADGNFIVGDGAAWVVESGATARTSLGLGTIATQAANNVSISGGSIAGITDLAIADGGTGQSTAQAAIDALTNVAAATNEHVLTKDTATGNAIFKAAAGGSSLPVVDETAIVYKTGNVAITQTHDINAYSAARVITWPNAALTVAGLEVANVFTQTQNLTLGTATGEVMTWKASGTIKSRFIVSADGNHQWRVNIQNDNSTRDNNTKVAFAFVQDTGANDEFAVYIFPVGSSYVQLFGARQTGLIVGLSGGSASVFPAPSSRFDVYESNTSSTTAIATLFQLRKNLTSGTPGVGFGAQIQARLESSTTEDTIVGRFSYEWATATHASRKALSKWTVYDTAEREGIRIEADGSNPMLGFLGAAAIARPASYTLAATATRTMPTPEAAFTGQDNAQAGAVYAKSADLNTLQTRLDSVEGVLRQLIIDLASTSGFGLLAAA